LNADDLLSRLEKVRPSVPGQWVALCPAHEDRSPSLSIRDCGDGRILLHCFAGCATEEVLSSLGLTFRDIMPPDRLRDAEPFKPLKWPPLTVLRAIGHDAMAMALLAEDIANRGTATMQERDDLFERAGSVLAAIRLAVNDRPAKYVGE